MFIFISCFDIPHTLCKVYQIDQFAVHVTRIKGVAKLYGEDELDPLNHILHHLYALRASFRPHQSSF